MDIASMADLPLHNVLTARARLGKGQFGMKLEALLYWVDIYNHWVHCFNPATGTNDAIDVGDTVGAISFTHTHQMLLALRHGLALLDLDSHAVSPIIAIETDRPNNHFNDGKCDAAPQH